MILIYIYRMHLLCSKSNSQNLKSSKIGRLAIYVPIITSTMHVLGGVPLAHGLTVIARQQTAATGRSQNKVRRHTCFPIRYAFVQIADRFLLHSQWLSPDGCLMFSVQLHVHLDTPLGERLSLLQHLVAVAVVNAVLSIQGYEVSRFSVTQYAKRMEATTSIGPVCCLSNRIAFN